MKLLILFFFIVTPHCWAQESRWIDLEWDAVPEARDYEIELFQEDEGEILSRGKFKTSDPKWSHAVPPGKYSLKLRSVDERGVPGEWSESIPLKVKIVSPLLIRPSVKEKVSDSLVQFEWNQVVGAANYQLVVRDHKKQILYNSTVMNLKESIYLKELGEYSWSVFAMGDDDGQRNEDQFPEKSFHPFSRVGGELEGPVAKVQIDDLVSITWDKVPDAQIYEIDFIPPPNKGEKNRRFRVEENILKFRKDKIKDGATTLTLKAIASGYQDSSKTLIKIIKKDDVIDSTNVETGKSSKFDKPIGERFWGNQLYLTLGYAFFNYESENFEKDTKLKQSDLTGAGLNVDWYIQSRPESSTHKLEVSILRLASGDESGQEYRLSYNYILPVKTKTKVWFFGVGASTLSLPTFFGDRMTDSVKVENASSLGPEIIIGLTDPLSDQWHMNANVTYSYQLVSLSSPADEGESFGWLRGQIRFLRYHSPETALYFGGEYQRWTQEFGDNSSSLNGWSLVTGIKKNW